MATPTTLPGDFNPGQVLTAADMDNLRGAFRVLQVVQGSVTTPVIVSTTAYVDTGLTATITPQSATSKVLVVVQQNGCGKEAGNGASQVQIQLLRTSTQIGYATAADTNISEVNYIGTVGIIILDSPATTSAVTYKTQLRNSVNSASVRVQTPTGNSSTITLLEISA
jgi:hypothetical protein